MQQDDRSVLIGLWAAVLFCIGQLACGGASPTVDETDSGDSNPQGTVETSSGDTESEPGGACPWTCLTEKGCEVAGGTPRPGYECPFASQLCCEVETGSGTESQTGDTASQTSSAGGTDATDTGDTADTSDSVTQTDGPCPFVCENWQACGAGGGTVRAEFTCANAAFVCCDDPVDTSSAPDTASHTTSDTSTDSETATQTSTEDTDTGDSDFGNRSLSLAGGAYAVVNDEAAVDITSWQWTIEAWVKVPAIDESLPILRKGGVGTGVATYYLYASDSVTYAPFGGYTYEEGLPHRPEASTSLTVDDWHHLALVNDGDYVTLFVDGVEADSVYTAGAAIVSNNDPLYLGANVYGSSFLTGALDEVRWSNVARYAASFTPAARFVEDGSTMALWHFDEGAGTASFDEVSGIEAAFVGDVVWSADVPY